MGKMSYLSMRTTKNCNGMSLKASVIMTSKHLYIYNSISLVRDLIKHALLATILLFTNVSIAAQPLGCIIEPELVSNVGSHTVGVVESVKVERGDHVRKGQVLATLQSNIERASVQLASTRSKTEADMRSAEEALKLARITEKRAVHLVEKKFVSQQALDKAIAETALSEQKLALTKEQLKTLDSELSFARAQLNDRTIRSPFDGIIADRFVWPGERVEEKPLFRVAKINPLRVEMVISAALYGTIAKGASLEITPLLPNSNPVLATVVLVDQLIDGASNTFRVRAEIPNEDLALPSGLRCNADIPDNTVTTASRKSDNQKVISHNKSSSASIYQLRLATQLGKTNSTATNIKQEAASVKQKKYQ
jgi:membrane fusion protein, heavy metal efflux system